MKNNILSLVLILILMVSCEDFLKEEHVSGIGYAYYDTEEGIEDLVRSAYQPLRMWGGTQGGVKLSNHGTDLWEYTGEADGAEFHQYTSALNPSNNEIYTVWYNFYFGISRCNIGINRIPQLDEATDFLRTDAGKNARIGELKFLRGWYYFYLVQMFGEIPLLLEENIGVLTDMKRADVPAVYQAIISDLKFASDHLPATQSDYARPPQCAAQQLLAKVYLTRGSAITEERGQKPSDMDSAAYYAEKVIEYKGDLLPNYDDARRPLNEKNKEVLFAVQWTTNKLYNDVGNRNNLFYTIRYYAIPGLVRQNEYGGPWTRLRPTDYLYDLYDRQNDSRFYKTFNMLWHCNDLASAPVWTADNAPSPDLVGKKKLAIGDTALWITMNYASDEEIKAKPYTWLPRNKFTDHQFPQYKYHLDPLLETYGDFFGKIDFKLIWYSEAFLIAAEAYGRNGDYVKAAEYINVVRRRAAYKEGELKPLAVHTVDNVPSENMEESTELSMEITAEQINSFEKLRDFILEERAREFLGDNERWFDLVRTETFLDRVKEYNNYTSTVRPYHKLRPIPINHIDRLDNAGPLSEEQNEGYY